VVFGAYKAKGGCFVLLQEQYEANRWPASVRMSVEHAFGHIAKYWMCTAFAEDLCPSN
jgi:hypothetical protein